MKKYLMLLGILLVFAISCGDELSTTMCNPGSVQKCLCATQQIGIQTCNVQGAGWSACVGCFKESDAYVGKKDAGISPDYLAHCSVGQFACINDKAIVCNAITGMFDLKEDCSTKNYGDIKFGCSMCNTEPKCLPSSNMFTGTISKYIGYSYSHREPDCKKNHIFSLDASYVDGKTKIFYHRVINTDFTLVVSVRDVVLNFTDTFYSSKSSAAGNYHKVQVRLYNESESKSYVNYDPNNSGTPKVPAILGTFSLKFTKLALGSSYTLLMEGMIESGGVWKSIKYEAKGFIKVVKLK